MASAIPPQYFAILHLDENPLRFCLTSPWMHNGNVVVFLKENPDTYCVDLVSRSRPYMSHSH
jgi:hypothetical protein